MSFGRYQYQHRFFQNPRIKKGSLNPNTYNSIFPQINTPNLQYEQLSTYQTSPITNTVNIATRAGPIRPNDPGWDAYRLKSYVTEQFSQDYQQNAQTLERFKRQAEEYRRRKRFGSVQNPYYRSYSPVQQIYRDLEDNKVKMEQLKKSIQNPLYNPEIYRYHYENQLKSRLQRYEIDRQNMMSRVQLNETISKRKLKEYKKKYSKLKEKLKQQILQRKKKEMENIQQKEALVIQKSANKLQDIQKMLSHITTGLQQNSQLFNQSLKIQSEIKMKNSSFSENTSKLKNHSLINEKRMIQAQKEVVSEDEQDNKLPKLTPKIMYTQKKLQSQYKQLQNLKKYIQTVDSRIKRLRTQ